MFVRGKASQAHGGLFRKRAIVREEYAGNPVVSLLRSSNAVQRKHIGAYVLEEARGPLLHVRKMPDTDLHVVAEIVAKPGSEDAVRDVFIPFAQGVPHEPGCKKYQLLESHTQPGHFITVEIWADQASLDAHMKTPQIAAAIVKLQPLLAKPLLITPLKALT